MTRTRRFVVPGVILAIWWVLPAVRAGTIVGWGETATPQSTLTNLVAISAGGYHSIVLKEDGSIVGWGGNEYGQSSPPPETTLLP